MFLSLWVYQHRHGVDVLKVLCEGTKTPSKEQVIKATDIEWEGEGSEAPREDEFLDHDIDLHFEDNGGCKEYGFPVISA